MTPTTIEQTSPLAEERHTILALAICDARPEVEVVDFDEDGEHVYLGTSTRPELLRYRLGREALGFIADGQVPNGGLVCSLEVPRPVKEAA